MKKFLMGIIGLILCTTLVGCSSTQAVLSSNIDNKLEKLSNTIYSLNNTSNQDIAFYDYEKTVESAPEALEVGFFNGAGFGTPYYSNVNTYNLPTFGGIGGNYGMYPLNNNLGYNGFGMNNGYGINNINGFGFNNAYGFNPYANNMGFASYGLNNFGFNSNIDTYRINSVTKNGKTNTTINTYKNGKHVPISLENTSNTDYKLQNLSNVCNNCITSNNYASNLKDNIIENINYVKTLSNQIKNGEKRVSNEQIRAVNELLDNIAKTTSKINMSRGEFNSEYNNVKLSKTSYESSPSALNSKYIKLLSCLDTRNSYLQNALNSLLEIENAIDGTTNNGYCWNGTCTNGTCPNGNCVDGTCPTCPDGICTNCENCPDCSSCNDCGTCNNCLTCNTCNNCDSCSSCATCEDCDNCGACSSCETCTNCTNCLNCKNCTDCVNCENCENCSNLANAKNCTNNTLNQNNDTIEHNYEEGDQRVIENTLNGQNSVKQTAETNVDEFVNDNLVENQTTPINYENDIYNEQNYNNEINDYEAEHPIDEFNVENAEYLSENNIPYAKTLPSYEHPNSSLSENQNYDNNEQNNFDNYNENYETNNSILNENEYENNKSLTA